MNLRALPGQKYCNSVSGKAFTQSGTDFELVICRSLVIRLALFQFLIDQ